MNPIKTFLFLLFSISSFAWAENSLNVLQVFEENYQNAPGITIRFDKPMGDIDQIEQSIKLVADTTTIEPNWIIGEDPHTVILPFLEPETPYTVSIMKGIKSKDGIVLTETYQKKITTRTLTASISFASKGTIIPPEKRIALPVTAVNVAEVDIDFFRVKPSELGKFFQHNNWQGNAHVWDLEQTRDWMTLAYSGRYHLSLQKNQRKTINLDLGAAEQLKQPGLYVAIMRQAGQYAYEYNATYFSISDIALHAREYNNHYSVFANSIESGEKLSGQNIHLLNDKGEVISTATTDAKGYAKIAKDPNGAYLQANQKNQFTLLKVNTHALDLSSFTNATLRHSPIEAFIYGPRDLYLPGETVPVNILLRDHDGKLLNSSLPLNAKIFSADGTVVKETTLQASSPGFYQIKHELSENAATGIWTLTVSTGDIKKNYAFKVEDFKPERMTLQLFGGPPKKQQQLKSDMITIPVEGSYLYGAPTAGNQIDGFITAQPDGYIFENHKSWYSGDSTVDLSESRIYFEKIALNSNGKATLATKNVWNNIEAPLLLNASISLYETGGRPVTRNTSISLLPKADTLLALEPQFSENPKSDSLVEFKLGALTKDGEFTEAKQVKVRLVRDYRSYYWRYSDSRGWFWDYESNPYSVFEQVIDISKDHNTIAVPVEWGEYQLEMTRPGSPKTVFQFSTDYDYWWENDNTSGKGRKPDAVQLGIKQKQVSPGDNVDINIIPPHAGYALVTVENSDGILWQDRFDIEESGKEVSIPTQKDWDRHDIYITAMVLQKGMNNGISPKRAFAFSHLPLKGADRTMKLSLTAPEKVEPGTTAKAQVKVDNAKAGTMVTMAMVDIGVLNITRFERPQPEQYFFSARRFDANLFDVYGSIVDRGNNPYARQLFGGDLQKLKNMAEANLGRGGKKSKSEVQIVSFMADPVAINDEGVAEFEFDIPQFNGSVRWMAVAFNDTQYGSSEHDMKVVDSVVTQISMPRFLAIGDQTKIALDVHNLSGEKHTLSIDMSFEGALAPQTFNQVLVLEDKEKQTLKIDLKSPISVGQGDIKLTLTSEGSDAIKVNRQWPIHVRAAYPSETISRRVTIEPGKTWKNDVSINHWYDSTVEAQLTISNQLPINFSSHFNYLLRYPYGCLEQTTSSGYPWVLLTPEISKRYLNKPYDGAERVKNITAAIDRLVGKQRSDGSFGYWDATSHEAHWGTVYATEFLMQARAEGVLVPSSMFENAVSKLQQYLRENSQIGNYYGSDEYQFITRAYAAYVLAKLRKTSLGDVRRLEKQMEGKNVTALSWVHLGLSFHLLSDENAAQRAFEKAKTIELAQTRHRYYYGDYGSEVRDLALAYSLLAEHKLDGTHYLYALSEAIRKQNWFSTQDRIALMRAANQINNSNNGKAWQATIDLVTMQQTVEETGAFNAILDLEQATALKTVTSKDQTLYLNYTAIGNSKTAPTPISNGVSISRTYYSMDGQVIDPKLLKSGDLVVVELTAKATNRQDRIPDALIVDLLPAGLELENQNLGNASVSLANVQLIDNSRPITAKQLHEQNNILHEEFRSDRYVAALDMRPYSTYRLFYLARAVTPGTFVVPPSYIEDMYKPSIHGIGSTHGTMTVTE